MRVLCESIPALLSKSRLNVSTGYSAVLKEVLDALESEALIDGYTRTSRGFSVHLSDAISNIRLVSRPSRPIYVTAADLLRRTKFNTGLWLVQTRSGVRTHRECIAQQLPGKCLLAVNNGFQHWC